MGFLGGVGATATATSRDLVRRPGVLLATAAVAALLLLLPDLCSRAVDDSAELSLQVGISTLATFLSLVAGFAGLRSGAREGDLAAAPEWLAAPVGRNAYVVGRVAGVVTACAALLAVLVLFLVPGQSSVVAESPPPAAGVALCALGLLLVAAQFAALGLLLATVTSAQLAAITFVGLLVATRTVVPELAASGGFAGTLSSVLPDPARLDLSRELAFRRDIDPASALTACLAAALHAAACLAVSAWALGRREA